MCESCLCATDGTIVGFCFESIERLSVIVFEGVTVGFRTFGALVAALLEA